MPATTVMLEETTSVMESPTKGHAYWVARLPTDNTKPPTNANATDGPLSCILHHDSSHQGLCKVMLLPLLLWGFWRESQVAKPKAFCGIRKKGIQSKPHSNKPNAYFQNYRSADIAILTHIEKIKCRFPLTQLFTQETLNKCYCCLLHRNMYRCILLVRVFGRRQTKPHSNKPNAYFHDVRFADGSHSNPQETKYTFPVTWHCREELTSAI